MTTPKTVEATTESSTKTLNSAPVGHTGVHYEIFVRSFADSNGDGIGDLTGVASNLNYLQDLGVSAIWLMPIHPSPSYHKYDITDYYGIDPEYGTGDDFRRLVAEAHQRGIAVLTDLVLHHTSIQHPWFIEASKGPQNPYRNYYKWLTPAQIKAQKLDKREVTADSGERNPWHPVPGATEEERYYGMFWRGMPDLNFDYPPVREAMFRIARYWLNDMGVDGFRLDAARHLYRESEEPKNHQFWQEFGQVVEAAKQGCYTVGEVWTRPERIAPYFGGLKANFNFDLCLAIEAVVRQGDDTKNLIGFLSSAQDAFARVNPQFIDALILSNHDQNRIGSLLKGDINRLKAAANLLLTLPGNPYLYYGEEIGMLGMKPDEHIREPFLWDIRARDRQRTSWRRGRYTTSQTVRPLAEQRLDPDSLFWHYKRLIQARNGHPVLNDNLSRLVQTGIRHRGILAFVRRSASGNRVLVIHNLTDKNIDVALTAEERWCRHLIFSTAKGALFNDSPVKVPAYGCVVIE